MLIFGASGFAKNVLEILIKNEFQEEIYFFDNVTPNIGDLLYDQFCILKSYEEIEKKFVYNKNFTIGIGNPLLRQRIYNELIKRGGNFVSTISNDAKLGSFNVVVEEGVNISFGVIINNDTLIKKGSLININSTIGHDCVIGEFVEICPNVSVSGNCNIGNNVFIGSNATIAPKVTIGDNAVIGANSLVLNDVPKDSFFAGIPAHKIK
ncbi:NeuD/PglB/VioB family sugar acetyltransferase [Myroides odoratimimus]|uniref:NeuD/PglB/VioB family sugar acetyltransferase n=1 Tax=Myroides odoratimimus TaxID=76832 RepID=UPI002574D554|nr:NeuD/PglB/VioB family sugar acetyltransferase [Myroides odoratimimus]MDM1096705.1 NeuD/PglB/VioB family sugar acetyltransferase [Myroides odoratimimus]